MNRREFLKAGAAAPVFVAVAGHISTGVVQSPTRAVQEGYLSIVGRMERTDLSFYRESRREFEANLDASLMTLRREFMRQYDQVQRRR